MASPNPNMLLQPNIKPPYPLWEPGRYYIVGDVVNWADMNWVLIWPFFGETPQSVTAPPPDNFPITFNNVPGKSPGIYNPVGGSNPYPDNPAGGRWVNLSLATPPAPTWSPGVNYAVGDVVMYPPESPGTYWRCVYPSFNNTPQLPFFLPGSVGLQIAPQNWELLNATSAPFGQPSAGVVADPLPPVPALATFGAVVVVFTIVCSWTLSPGVAYTGYTLTLTPVAGTPTVVTLTDGTLLTYTFTAVAPGTYSVSIVPNYFTQVGPGSTQSGLVVLAGSVDWGSFGIEYIALFPDALVGGTLNTYVDNNFSTTQTLNLYSNQTTLPPALITSVAGALPNSTNNYITVSGFSPTFISPPNGLTATANDGGLTPEIYLAFSQSGFGLVPLTINGGNPIVLDSPVTITWSGATPRPAQFSGTTITNDDYVYQLWRQTNGGTLSSLSVDGIISGTFTDNDITTTNGFIVGDSVKYWFVPRMVYKVNGVTIRQWGSPSDTTNGVT